MKGLEIRENPAQIGNFPIIVVVIIATGIIEMKKKCSDSVHFSLLKLILKLWSTQNIIIIVIALPCN